MKLVIKTQLVTNLAQMQLGLLLVLSAAQSSTVVQGLMLEFLVCSLHSREHGEQMRRSELGDRVSPPLQIERRRRR
jgi:hypothetical protein